ncbi:MAG: GNAT family N-acetyltransferase [Actinobacteria bacterium ATB1]|nr:GNAT family N-acetyltransferase [Actinobacteria bacterium ATB1]
MSEIQIRRARVGETGALVELWMLMMAEHQRMDPSIRLTPDAAKHYQSYLHSHLLDVSAIVLVAIEDRRPVGFTLAMKCQNLPMFEPEHYGYISDMVVHPSQRGRGLGQEMLRRTEDWLRRQGVSSVQLQVYTGNEPGQRFWSRAGFRPFLQRMWLEL